MRAPLTGARPRPRALQLRRRTQKMRDWWQRSGVWQARRKRRLRTWSRHSTEASRLRPGAPPVLFPHVASTRSAYDLWDEHYACRLPHWSTHSFGSALLTGHTFAATRRQRSRYTQHRGLVYTAAAAAPAAAAAAKRVKRRKVPTPRSAFGTRFSRLGTNNTRVCVCVCVCLQTERAAVQHFMAGGEALGWATASFIFFLR
jgi:hypothetical protein